MSDPLVTPDPTVTPESTSTPDPTQPTQPSEPTYSYREDRSAWVDPNRFRAAERATNLAAQRASQLETELALERQRVQRLAGVTPQDPNEVETGRVKAAFAQMYPNLARMAELDPSRLERILATGDQAEQVVKQHWDTHRDTTLTDLKAQVAQAMNVSELSKSAASKVIAAFKASVPDREDDPAGYARWAARYEQRDPTLLTEFVQEFVGDFITPAQRSGFVRPRVAVPSGGFSRPVATNQNRQPEYSKMKTVAEMLEAAEAQADAHYGS